jgi:heat shock protein HslJ
MDNPDSDTNETNTAGTGETSSNLAITIVVVVGILLGAVLLFNSPSGDRVSPTPGPGTPQISQPIATPPTTVPTSDRPTSVPATIPAVPTVTASVPTQTANPILGINWQWVSVTDKTTGQTTTVPAPAQYTIVFTADGFVNGLADCNSFTGTYSQANGMTIQISTMTRAACPEDSLDQQYIQLLENIAAGGPDGAGNLALETAGGAQRMLFQNGGPAQ